MTPVMQVGPDDCYRAAVASIFELPLADVPHFYGEGRTPLEASKVLRVWLHARGVVQISLPSSAPLAELLANLEVLNPGAHYILGGATRNGPEGHAVVGCHGRIVHDPGDPTQRLQADYTLFKPLEDGNYWVHYFGHAACCLGTALHTNPVGP